MIIYINAWYMTMCLSLWDILYKIYLKLLWTDPSNAFYFLYILSGRNWFLKRKRNNLYWRFELLEFKWFTKIKKNVRNIFSVFCEEMRNISKYFKNKSGLYFAVINFNINVWNIFFFLLCWNFIKKKTRLKYIFT